MWGRSARRLFLDCDWASWSFLLVLPPGLIDRFVRLREEMNLRTPTIPQLALARFIRDGRLDRHIHKMKKIYRNRRNQLIGAINRHFGDFALVKGDDAGMHVLVDFPDAHGPINWQLSVEYGVLVHSVEDYCLIKGRHRNQIVLGFGNIREEGIEAGIERLYRFMLAQREGFPRS